MTARAVAPLAALALMAVALPAGGRVFGVAVLLLAVVALLVFTAMLQAQGPRPVVLAAAVAGVGTPLRLLLDPAADLAAIPALAAGMILTAFGLAMVTGRRAQIATALGFTVFCGLLVGAGTAGLVALRFAERGFRWALGAVVLTVLPEAAGMVAERIRPGQSSVADGARAVVMAAAAGALLTAANPPFTPAVTAVALGICAAAAFAGAAFERAVGDAPADQRGLGRAFGGLLLAAPALYVLTTVVQN